MSAGTLGPPNVAALIIEASYPPPQPFWLQVLGFWIASAMAADGVKRAFFAIMPVLIESWASCDAIWAQSRKNRKDREGHWLLGWRCTQAGIFNLGFAILGVLGVFAP